MKIFMVHQNKIYLLTKKNRYQNIKVNKKIQRYFNMNLKNVVGENDFISYKCLFRLIYVEKEIYVGIISIELLHVFIFYCYVNCNILLFLDFWIIL